MTSTNASISMWSPLKSKTYLVLFVATVLSNIGTWMHEVAASWKMTEMTQDPAMVALIQTSITLPIFFFALPAGALADLIDRRKLLIAINCLAFFTALSLATLIQLQQVTPIVLLVFTFLLGVCAAFIAPAWQSIVPNLLPKEQLSAAVSLNGVGINISRAIGPALAGILIVSAGLETPFWLNSVSYLFILLALCWWTPKPETRSGLPKEHILPAIVSGIRYAKNSPALKATLVRAVAFFLPASAFWALLPIIVNQGLQAQANLFGISTGLVGIGALLGSYVLPKFKTKYTPSALLLGVSIVNAFVYVGLSLFLSVPTLLVSCLLFGSTWIIALANLNVSAQTSLPNWVRARGLAVFLTIFFGSMSIGSLIWGNVAAQVSISASLLIASTVLLVGGLLTIKFKLNIGSDEDLEPALYWPTPEVAHDIADDKRLNEASPVLVTIQYEIHSQHHQAFLHAVKFLGEARKKYGAYQWGIMQDVADSSAFTEYFFESSWLQHLHHHERTSGDDKIHQQQVNQFHQGESPPKVTHLVGPNFNISKRK